MKSVLSGVGFGGHQDLWRKRQSKEGGAEIFFFLHSCQHTSKMSQELSWDLITLSRVHM